MPPRAQRITLSPSTPAPCGSTIHRVAVNPSLPPISSRFARALARPPHRAALRIAVAYAAFGALWVLCSDAVVGAGFSRAQIDHLHVQTIKGWLFIAVTAVSLYVLIRRSFSA